MRTAHASFELHENRARFSRGGNGESSRSIATIQIRGKIIAPRPQELLLLERLRGGNESIEGREEQEDSFEFFVSFREEKREEHVRRRAEEPNDADYSRLDSDLTRPDDDRDRPMD